MPNLYPLARHVFGRLSPEFARDLTLWCLEAGLGGFMVDSSAREQDPQILAHQVWDLPFKNPIGLAAGFDKDVRVLDSVMANWGLGFVEVGTITPEPQYGNAKPRVFRLKEDEGIINRMGFNSRGLSFAVQRLRKRAGQPGIVGVNLGKNRESADATADYEMGINATAGLANYLVVNVSSPNTPGLRDLQRRGPLESLLKRLVAARDKINVKTPLLVKIAPDLTTLECDDIAAVALECGINGIVVSNTTTARPSGLGSSEARHEGGLSGKPLFESSTRVLAQMYVATHGKIPLIGVGGVATASDAYEKICAGASLIQLYTALAFHGPMLVTIIKKQLAHLLITNGFSSISAAVGTKSEAWKSTFQLQLPSKPTEKRRIADTSWRSSGRSISPAMAE